MNKTQLQNSAEILADLLWTILEDILDVSDRARPPLFFFLSAKSRHSLIDRSLYEIDLVHRQQFFGEGITLKYPPTAWVSKIEQTPEETGHLFALTYQPSSRRYLRSEISAPQELWSMTLHECFGKFASQLIFGLGSAPTRPKKLIREPQDLWEAAHREGYFLGVQLAKSYFSENLRLQDLKKWFSMNWYDKKSPKALQYLYRLVDQTPPTSDFKKFF